MAGTKTGHLPLVSRDVSIGRPLLPLMVTLFVILYFVQNLSVSIRLQSNFIIGLG
jgi:F0F1-type ATP synthase membrane subunit a